VRRKERKKKRKKIGTLLVTSSDKNITANVWTKVIYTQKQHPKRVDIWHHR